MNAIDLVAWLVAALALGSYVVLLMAHLLVAEIRRPDDRDF